MKIYFALCEIYILYRGCHLIFRNEKLIPRAEREEGFNQISVVDFA